MRTINAQLKEIFGQKEIKPEVHVIEVPPQLRRGEYGDVIAIRHPLKMFRRFTNIPWVMGDNVDKADGYEWGYSGGGPADFAINILMHFTDHDETVSRAFYLDFRDRYLAEMPKEGGRIAKEKVFSFIQDMKENYPNLIDAVRNDLELGQKLHLLEKQWAESSSPMS
jgi:hypothetical protein